MKIYKYTAHKVGVLIFSLIFILIFFLRIRNTPDFTGYGKYVLMEGALERFSNEPVAAIILGISGLLGSLEIFFLSGVVLYMFAIWRLMRQRHFYSLPFFINSVCNPFTLIMFYVPRNSLAVSFGLLLLSTDNKYSRAIIHLISFFSHNFVSFVNFLTVKYVRSYLYTRIIIVAIFLIGLYATTGGLMSGTRFDLSHYANAGSEVRGVTRNYYFLSVVLLTLLLQVIYNNFRVDVGFFVLSIASCYMLFLNPFSNRIAISFYIFYFSAYYCSDNFAYKTLNIFILPISLFLFVFVLVFGNYGYG